VSQQCTAGPRRADGRARHGLPRRADHRRRDPGAPHGRDGRGPRHRCGEGRGPRQRLRHRWGRATRRGTDGHHDCGRAAPSSRAAPPPPSRQARPPVARRPHRRRPPRRRPRCLRHVRGAHRDRVGLRARRGRGPGGRRARRRRRPPEHHRGRGSGPPGRAGSLPCCPRTEDLPADAGPAHHLLLHAVGPDALRAGPRRSARHPHLLRSRRRRAAGRPRVGVRQRRLHPGRGRQRPHLRAHALLRRRGRRPRARRRPDREGRQRGLLDRPAPALRDPPGRRERPTAGPAGVARRARRGHL
ncbi:MAG: M23 peptidase domain protein, partial [uncultured Blastococcus sp.]